MPSVFISYAREDREIAIRLYRDLSKLGLDPWIDVERLLPGERWKDRISSEIRTASHFIALLSSRSVDKRGIVQWEIREAIETLKQVPDNAIYFIPVRLDECRLPLSSIEDIHWVDLFPDYEAGFLRIAAALDAPVTLEAPPFAGRQEHAGRIADFVARFLRDLQVPPTIPPAAAL